MKKFLMMLMVVLSTSALFMADMAEAKRVGGGRNVGRQNTTVQRTAPPAQNATAANGQQAAAAQQGRRNGMMGLLGGLAAGLGLAALASAFGLGEGFGIFLLILLLGIAALVAFRMFAARRMQQGQPQAAGAHGGAFPANLREAMNRQANAPLAGGSAAGATGAAAGAAAAPATGAAAYSARMEAPAGFDADAFVRQAKVQFVRLQAAFDTKNSDDLREFTSPEMFGELNVEMMQRGDAPQSTDVVELDAQLLGVHVDGAMQVASVHFSGLIREEADAAAQPFQEVWNFSRPVSGASGWVLAGIQQLD